MLFRIMTNTIYLTTIQLYEKDYMTTREYKVYVPNLLVLKHTVDIYIII